MKKYKLTEEVKQEIKAAIGGLPKLYQENHFTRFQVRGSTLIERGVLEVNNKPVNPKKNYSETRNTEIDHQKNGEKEYQEGGILALTAYVLKYTKIAKDAEAKKNSLADH